jgi:hypothetical protein
MWTKGWIRSFMAAFRSPLGRTLLLAAYYVAIIAILVIMYGRGNLASTEFIYQGF